ncbi:MAG: histidinol dehydrogenase [Chloroflexota bacterium]|nr:histidinol dehydrogenase [Chloroflexota bacterium]
MTAAAPTPTLSRRLVWDEVGESERARWIGALRPSRDAVDVTPIIDAVRGGGDAALRQLTLRFDGAALDGLWVEEVEIVEAARTVDKALVHAIDASIAAVRRFHADQRDALRAERVVQTLPGVNAWRRWTPLERVGAYIPGGRAPLASSVIMTGVPAKLAGVDELIVATPPAADGRVAPAILVAARRVGVDRILRVGGAQAIAALAYGTESVAAVDRIVGAGNAWVTAAKRAVSADVAIDLPAGPSECVVVADADADPVLIALDLLAQAEHGPDSVAVLVTDDVVLLDSVEERLPALAATLATGERALETLRRQGGVILLADLAGAPSVSDAIAPEHLSLQCAAADALAARVRHVGSVFIGPWSAIAAGDYATGTNHVLPTGGAAQAYGGLGVEAFGRWIEVQRLTPAGVRAVADTVDLLAGWEGLPAHGRSVRARAELAAETAGPEDPIALLRRPEPVEPYPAEASDEELAKEAGLPVERIARMDMNTLPAGEFAEYGDLGYHRLRDALSAATGAPPERIVPGAGADELIRLVTTQALGPGDAVVVPIPTFAMFAVEARIAGARVVSVPREELGRRQPVDQLRAAAEESAARLVWLCTPNNPTGDAYSLDEIRQLAAGLSALVVVDEVYLEFAEETLGVPPNSLSAQTLQDELANVLVLRSLSKAYGMAGARVGYLVVPDPLAERFDAVRLPLSVAAPSEALAIRAIADGESARRRRAAVIVERDRLAAALIRLGCRVLPSVANFVTFQPPDAATLAEGLQRRGLIVRRYDTGPMTGWVRATARPANENDRLLDALEEVVR